MHTLTATFVTPGIYDLLAAYDPPDPDFSTIVQPTVEPLQRVPADSGVPPVLADAANRIAANEEQQAAFAHAFRLTIDKAQGALQANDQCWASAQLHTAERYARQLADLIAAERQLRTSLHSLMAGQPQLPVSAAELRALQQEVAGNGFPPDVLNFLEKAGIDDVAKERVRYLLQHSLVDLELFAGTYSYDMVSTVYTPGGPEDEASWRLFTETRRSAEYVCADAGLKIRFNASSFAAPANLTAVATLFPPPHITQPVDAYIVIQLPTGQFLSLQENGGVVPGIVPFARSFVPYAFDRPVLQYTFSGSEPHGTYTWYSVLAQAGTLNFVGSLHQTHFTVP